MIDENLQLEQQMPSEQAAEELGAVALSPDQAANTAYGNDPEHPRGNPALAESMAYAVKPLEQMIANISVSSLADKETRIEDLRLRGDELANTAKERYFVEKIIYDKVRDTAVGKLICVAGGEIGDQHGAFQYLFDAALDEDGNYSVHGSDKLPLEQIKKLADELFLVAGADSSSVLDGSTDWSAIPRGEHNLRSRFYETNLGNGIKLAEQVILNPGSGQVEHLRFAAVSGVYAQQPEIPEE